MSTLQITRGADFAAELVFDDGETPPVAVNLTGATVTAVFSWRDGAQSASVAMTDAVAGRVDIALTETETILLPQGRLSTLTITTVSAGGETEIQRCDVEAV